MCTRPQHSRKHSVCKTACISILTRRSVLYCLWLTCNLQSFLILAYLRLFRHLHVFCLSCIVSEIRLFKCRKSTIFPTPLLFRLKFGGVPLTLWSRSVMLESAESEMVSLISREIIFAEFQPIWSRYLNITDRRTDRQLSLALLCYA